MPNRYEREYGYDIERLAPEVREQVLEKHREWNIYDEWWDFVYEDAERMGALMGIRVEDISFTGFCSQGDGASFTGRYMCKQDAVEAITKECGGQDKELIRIATELTQLQVAWKIEHGFTWECSIDRLPGTYSHSGVMQTGWNDDEDRFAGIPFELCQDMDTEVERLMRDFADWIYKQLEAEYEHLTSEETLIESFKINGLRFSSSGETI